MVGRESKSKPKESIYVGSSVVLSVPLWGGILIIEKLGICGLKGYMGNLCTSGEFCCGPKIALKNKAYLKKKNYTRSPPATGNQLVLTGMIPWQDFKHGHYCWQVRHSGMR